MKRTLYASVVVSLMYAMLYTRPDIAYIVGVVSRYISNPSKHNWEAVKWILKYLKMVSITLCFRGAKTKLQGYIDLDLKGYLNDMRITMEFFTLVSIVLSWVSRL